MDEDFITLLGALGADPILGARAPGRSRVALSRRVAANRAALVKALVPKTPGVNKPGARNIPLGFTPIVFTPTTALNQNLVAQTQRPFRGQRLVLDLVPSAAGVGGLVTVTSIMVGQVNMLASAQPIIAAAFVNNATYVQLDIDAATPGIIITIGIQIGVVPGAGATLSVGATLFGLAVG